MPLAWPFGPQHSGARDKMPQLPPVGGPESNDMGTNIHVMELYI